MTLDLVLFVLATFLEEQYYWKNLVWEKGQGFEYLLWFVQFFNISSYLLPWYNLIFVQFVD